MPISFSPTADAAFEARLRRKSEGGSFAPSKQAALAAAESYEEKVRRKLKGGDNGSNNIPSRHLEVNKEKTPHKSKAKGKRSTICSMPTQNFTGSTKPTNITSHHIGIGQEDYSQASSVSFDALFTDLCQFQKENNGSLDIPASHQSFSRIMDNLTTMGMEELLKKRWDYQFASLKAFKREHGDLLIPASHPTLGAWVRVQLDHYKLFKQRLPSPVITKKRFGKLEGIGFDDFVSWEEAGCTRAPKQPIQAASSTETNGSEGENESEPSLSLDEKLRRRKKTNNIVKFQERAAKARSSSKKNERKKSKEAVSAELFEKRMLQRSVRRGLGRRQSSRFIIGDLEGGHSNSDHQVDTDVQGKSKDERKDKSLRRFSHMVRSTSSSNLCPGSWECSRCSLINEPIGLEDQQSSCRACGGPNAETNDERNNMQYQEKSLKLGDLASHNVPPNFKARKCDMFVESWSQLGSVLASTIDQSVDDLAARQREKILDKESKFNSTTYRRTTQ